MKAVITYLNIWQGDPVHGWEMKITLFEPGSQGQIRSWKQLGNYKKNRPAIERYDVTMREVIGVQFSTKNNRHRPVGLPQHVPGNASALPPEDGPPQDGAP